ncbi:hypothetical protein AVEN_119392-1 [Araneus ventricosus]|uniref:Endonuclease/exonuclease/phosphatase domain-containing protein n=1 Tax=Araneus ventricosus TaxID=182803 RepID=A0A4Y2M7F0_ARAVE|nr:hypothetical protein AVEN_119392-1 [Araneus ventricosus]
MWNCARANKLGNQLNSFALHAKMKIIAPEYPTFHARHSESVIDLAITRNITYHITADSLIELCSDHLPVRFHIDTKTDTSLYDVKKFTPNWKKFQEYLLSVDTSYPPPNTKKEIETEVNTLTSLIIEAHTQTGKWVTEKPDIYSEAVRTQKEARNRLRRVWQRSRHPEDKRNFKTLRD